MNRTELECGGREQGRKSLFSSPKRTTLFPFRLFIIKIWPLQLWISIFYNLGTYCRLSKWRTTKEQGISLQISKACLVFICFNVFLEFDIFFMKIRNKSLMPLWINCVEKVTRTSYIVSLFFLSFIKTPNLIIQNSKTGNCKSLSKIQSFQWVPRRYWKEKNWCFEFLYPNYKRHNHLYQF